MRTKKSSPDSGMEAAGRIKEEAGELKSSAQESASATYESAKKTGGELVETTEENVRGGYLEARSSLLRVAEERRQQAAGKVDDYRRAAVAAASKLKEDGEAALGDHLQDLTRRLVDASSYLGNTKVKKMAPQGGEIGNGFRRSPFIAESRGSRPGPQVAHCLRSLWCPRCLERCLPIQ